MNNPGIKNGLFLGLSLIVYTLLIYLISPAFFLAGWGFASIFISLLIYILFMVKTANEYRAMNNDYASFSEILVPAFICAFIGGVISTIFTYILSTYIDTELPQLLQDLQISQIEDAAWIPEEAKEAAIESIEEQNAMEPSFKSSMMAVLMGSVAGLLIALVIAAIKKNEHPNDLLT